MFDPVQKTLLADQGEIRVGSKYQAEIPDKLAEGEQPNGSSLSCPQLTAGCLFTSGELDSRIQEKLETKVWDPDNQLKDPQIDQFLVVAR